MADTFYKTTARAKLRMKARADGRGAKTLVAYISTEKTAQLCHKTRCPGCQQTFYTQPERRSKTTCCSYVCYKKTTGETRSLSNEHIYVSDRYFVPNIVEPAIVSCPDCARVSYKGFTFHEPSEDNPKGGHAGPGRWPFCAKCSKKRRPDILNVDVRGAGWRVARLAALERDNHRCQHCKQQAGKGMHVHHIKPFRCFKLSAHANRLRNLITLCPGCHAKADKQARVQWPKNHPDYKAARPVQAMRGASWPASRKTALARDASTCQACRSDVRKGLHVHHIVPLREFADENEGNHPRNLITLCPACHHKAERHAKEMWPTCPPSDTPEHVAMAWAALIRPWPTAARALLREHLQTTRGSIKIALRVDLAAGCVYEVALYRRPSAKNAANTAMKPCLPNYPAFQGELRARVEGAYRIARRKHQEDQFILTPFMGRYDASTACCCLEEAGFDLGRYSRHDTLFLGDPELHEQLGDAINDARRAAEHKTYLQNLTPEQKEFRELIAAATRNVFVDEDAT